MTATAAPTVLVSTRSFSTGDRDLVGELTAAGLRVVRVATDHDPSALAPDLRTATAWIAGTAPVTAELVAAAPALRVIARYGVGVESVDVAAADRAGVIVTNTPGANSEAVSEHTVALVFAALRRVADGDARVRCGDWTVSRGRQLAGGVAAVIGFGRIGRGTAGRLTALGCRVLVHDPYVDAAAISADGHEASDLDGIRRRADVVVLHSPGGALLVDRAWLADCREGQLIVNTARADLVDEHALAEALHGGRLFAYAADTLGSESRSDHVSPLLDPALHDRVTITPHLGAQTTEAVDGMGGMAVEAVLAVLAGRAPEHRVHPPTSVASATSTPPDPIGRGSTPLEA
ncbi:NAD(P)-dependent oxidoreductase [Nakamurella sp. A5-74]|uniref:NAD(P)-dependent oxidoreductase n=1 Tax=Nakamurella sp. A5-74 TaxID=3158264 RepID=A0AAU8DMR7_9ACTN